MDDLDVSSWLLMYELEEHYNDFYDSLFYTPYQDELIF